MKLFAKFLLATGFSFWSLACGGEDQPGEALQEPVVVKTEEAQVRPLSMKSTYSGTIEPLERVRLSTKIMGWIEKIYFDEGESVEKGALLVKLRSEDLQAKGAQAQAAINAAEVHFKNVETNLARIESLFEKKAATQKELDDARAAFASAKSGLETAREMKKEVEYLLRYTALIAPFDGVVSRKMLEEGDLANPGQPILEVEDMSKAKIVAKVPESEVLTLEIGMPVTVFVQASSFGTNGNKRTYAIDKIVPSADAMSRQFDVHVLVDNPDGVLRSGMFARIAAGKAEEMTLLVPQAAVFSRGQLEGVFTVDAESKARLRWIRTGTRQNDWLEVLSGLNPGDRIIVEGVSQIMDGQTVEVK
ncbi:MAG: efflux RND transporter periplasmic adaptor subunit [bacterium]